MIRFMNRNLKLYFRDRGAVLFSLLAVFIIIGLYTVFLGDVWGSDLDYLEAADQLMNTWLIAGILAVASVTTTLGAFGVMVDDRIRKISKDFYAAPVRRISITGGYLGNAFIVGVIMSIVTLVLAQGYLVMKGGHLLSAVVCLKVLGIVLVCTLANTAMICFLISFLKSNSAFTSASTVLGTLVGFLTGIYLPIGSLPEAVQTVIKIFPASHGASLLRQVIMEAVITDSFAGIPEAYVTEFKEYMGITYRFGTYEVPTGMSILILAGTAVVFFGLAFLNMSRKRR